MAKQKSLDHLIKDAIKEGPLVAFYIVAGIDALKEKLNSNSDEDNHKLLGGMINPQQAKNSVEKIYNHLNQTEK